MFIVIRRIKEEKQRERERLKKDFTSVPWKIGGDFREEIVEESREGCRIILYAGKRGLPRSAPLDSPAWSKCWRRCLPRAPGKGIKWTGRKTVEAVLPTEVRRPGGADRRPGLRVLVFPARIRASVVELPLKVITRSYTSFFSFLKWRLRDLFIMEILFDGRKVDVSSLANFLKRSKRNDEEDWMVCERLGNKLWDWSNIGFLIWCVYFFVVINLNYWNYFKKSELRRL